jgi:16S rRNA (guanine527-N7)-methyltransferase
MKPTAQGVGLDSKNNHSPTGAKETRFRLTSPGAPSLRAYPEAQSKDRSAVLGLGFHNSIPLGISFALQSTSMDCSRIADLLSPFLQSGPANTAQLTGVQLDQISTYIDLLVRWNARINLTAIRTPEEIVTRHFGESLFAARHLLPAAEFHHGPVRGATGVPPVDLAQSEPPPSTLLPPLLVDLGSGAGFPGLPMKIWSPQTRITLIESSHKKVAFLREVIRALTLTDIDVFPGRAETSPPASATLLTLRAVERFDEILPSAATLLAREGRMALLIGQSQVPRAHELLPSLHWLDPIPIPNSQSRTLLPSGIAAPLGPTQSGRT